MTSSKLNAPFLLFAVALLLWSGAAGLSSKLADVKAPHDHASGHDASDRETAQTPAQASAQAVELRKAVEANPDSVPAKLALASQLQEEAFEKKDNALLMEAVQSYQAVLSKEAENVDALLGMAGLCFEAGILDKAHEYYERYLKLRPNDLRAKTDFALVSLQASQLDEANAILEQVIATDPKLFQAQLALALVYKLKGNPAAAEKADEAKRLAPSEEERAQVDSFLKNFEQAVRRAGAEDAPPAPADPGEVSPAQLVAQVFQSHPIVGPRVKSISWPELSSARIVVENFPVEQMPPFAREKFLSNIKQQLKNLPDKVKITLYDAETQRELLSLEGGGDAK